MDKDKRVFSLFVALVFHVLAGAFVLTGHYSQTALVSVLAVLLGMNVLNLVGLAAD